MNPQRLIIVIPTYNRAACLRLLLKTLAIELAGLGDRVGVLVSDNGSTDETPSVTAAFIDAVPGARVVRQATNLGPDENFCRCVEMADADYFWMIGDDDLPRAGAVREVVAQLDRHAPDLMYLASDWHPALVDNAPTRPVAPAQPLSLDRLAFARRVNVWTTFISGWVVRRDTFAQGAGAAGLRRFANTNLVQLAWILGTLQSGRTFLYVREPYVLATAGNTGGYGLLKVFGENFARIVGESFGEASPIARAMVRRCVVGYLPGLTFSARFGNLGDFAREDPVAALRPRLGRRLTYPLLVAIGRSARPLASAALFLCKAAARLLRLADRVSEALHGARRLPT